MFKTLKDRFLGQNAAQNGGKPGKKGSQGGSSRTIENGREYKLVRSDFLSSFSFFFFATGFLNTVYYIIRLLWVKEV